MRDVYRQRKSNRHIPYLGYDCVLQHTLFPKQVLRRGLYQYLYDVAYDDNLARLLAKAPWQRLRRQSQRHHQKRDYYRLRSRNNRIRRILLRIENAWHFPTYIQYYFNSDERPRDVLPIEKKQIRISVLFVQRRRAVRTVAYGNA